MGRRSHEPKNVVCSWCLLKANLLVHVIGLLPSSFDISTTLLLNTDKINSSTPSVDKENNKTYKR